MGARDVHGGCPENSVGAATVRERVVDHNQEQSTRSLTLAALNRRLQPFSCAVGVPPGASRTA